MKIGVFGNGFVGGAVINGFSREFNVVYYDVNPSKSKNSIEEVLEADIIFLCVPTPQDSTGLVNMCFVEQLIGKIMLTNSFQEGLLANKLFVMKSTVPPGTCDELSERCQLKFLSNPEFLTERFANEDFLSPRAVIIGAKNEEDALRLKKAYQEIYGPLEQAEVGGIQLVKYALLKNKESETVKYVTNVFFSVKVAFMNMVYQMCQAKDIDYDKVVEGFLADGRVHNEHLSVPGPDGKLGFGGKCFPKDLAGFMNYLQNNDINADILQSVQSYNQSIRDQEL